MESPSPVPRCLVVKNGSNMRCRFSGVIPAPLSLITSEICGGSTSERNSRKISMRGLSPECWIPFSTRLIKACFILLRSILIGGMRSDPIKLIVACCPTGDCLKCKTTSCTISARSDGFLSIRSGRE